MTQVWCRIGAAVLAAAVGGSAGAAAPAPAVGPRAEFKTLTLDLGQVPRGQSAEARFELVNRGDELLKILEVKPG